ncbi:MAG: 2'-5' RNA ligase family protein [Gemmatimonadota bacterium]|nr:2'-5' RNA ligase family protein [Gemmatimonadota bacterium]
MNSGIFTVTELTGTARDLVLDVQLRFDPKLAKLSPPHITITGSSGVGPIPGRTSEDRLRTLLQPITDDTEPIEVRFGRPRRFMQTNIIVLPLDPHGPLRTLHERIATCGLRFERSKFTFSPHCTLSFFPEITPDAERGLMQVRLDEPFLIERVQFYHSTPPQPAVKLLELALKRGPV